MKFLSLLFSFIFVLSLSAHKTEFSKNPGWTIVSSKLDKSIHPDSVIIQGNIKVLSSKYPLQNVRVGIGQKEVSTDSDGNFSITGAATDTLFYCYRPGWTEIYELFPKFKKQHRITIEVYLDKKKQLMRKPIIYLYNNQPLNATIHLKPKGDFTFTYPNYTNKWNIRINPNGNLTDLKTNKEYPYLFWEAETQDLFFNYSEKQLEGWMIKTDSCITFLENKLAQLGLNDTEQTDFITFWAPIMAQNEYALVQFIVDDAYQNTICEMTIEPKPDAIRRVYILTAPLDRPYIGLNVVPQNLQPFIRKGFTILEWGGTKLDFSNIKF